MAHRLMLLAKWLLYCFGLMTLALSALLIVNAVNYITSRPSVSDTTAYRLCAEIGGPNAGFFFDRTGKLVCTNKRGNKLRTQP